MLRNNIFRTVTAICLATVILICNITSAFSLNKDKEKHKNNTKWYESIHKKWWFWTGITIIAGVIYHCANQKSENQEPIDYRTDSDGDSIPDYYERMKGLNPYESNVGKDTDNDGYDDITEYREGGDPTDAGVLPQDDAHMLSVQGTKTTVSNNLNNISIIPNPVLHSVSFNVFMPIKENIWLYGTIIPETNNYKIQIVTRY